MGFPLYAVVDFSPCFIATIFLTAAFCPVLDTKGAKWRILARAVSDASLSASNWAPDKILPRERAAPPHRLGNVDFVAYTSILEQVTLVLKTDRTGALPKFAFGSPLILLAWMGEGRWHRESNAGERR